MTEAPQEWWVYLLQSTVKKRTYIGIACDVDRRLLQHNGERAGGARSTRSGRPWRLERILGPYKDRSIASKVEYHWKKARGRKRLTWQPPAHDLTNEPPPPPAQPTR